MGNFASLCILSYKRPQQLVECIESLKRTADYPYELIVNIDGGDSSNFEYLTNLVKIGAISKLIISSGNNRGVGTAFQNCLGVTEGQYIFKIDGDLTFKDKWLSTAVNILEKNPSVGAVSLFDYRNYDPADNRFQVVSAQPDYLEVNDFVSSIYGFRAVDLPKITPVADDGNHSKLGTLAITLQDMVINHGFGALKSTYVSGTDENPYKTPTFNEPVVFLKGMI